MLFLEDLPDLDVSTRILDDARLLQSMGDGRHAGSPNPEHLREKILCEVKVSPPAKISRTQRHRASTS
jgi:hypothetical protein